jgi:hypothetical protein
VIPGPHEFGAVMLAASGLGAVAACLSALGVGRIYERVGRGYLDVADTDPVVQSAEEPLEVTEVREMQAATEALRRERVKRFRAGQDRVSRLLREVERE